MWTLECDGDVLKGRKIWLRPGTKHLLGRTRPPSPDDEHTIVIENKSVSRQHLLITVGLPTTAGQGQEQEHSRAAVLLSDDSKIGTLVDDRRIQKETIRLSKDEHSVKLGSFDRKFKIKWTPVVLTPATHSRRPAANLEDTIKTLSQADIIIDNVYTHRTTHILASKRNLATCLQGLVSCKYIVTPLYLEALCQATSVIAQDECPLETDFEKHWPDPRTFVPPAGKEPNPSRESAFAPNPKRLDIFLGYNFIFFDNAQYEQLSPVIHAGSGKAHLYTLLPETRDIASFTKFVDRFHAPKIVVVRFPRTQDCEQWMIDFLRSSELALGRRAMEQNEFLGAILNIDLTPLNRPLVEEIVIDSSVPVEGHQIQVMTYSQGNPDRAANMQTCDIEPVGSAPEVRPKESPTAMQGNLRSTIVSRAPYKSKFESFDDYDPADVLEESIDQIENEDEEQSMLPHVQGIEATEEHPYGASAGVLGDVYANVASPRPNKRGREEELTSDAAMLDSLMPTAAALKRQRTGLAERRQQMHTSPRKQRSAAAQAAEKLRQAREKADADLDIRAIAKSRKDEQDRQAHAEEERQREAREGVDVAAMRNLVIVEDWEAPIRDPTAQPAGQAKGASPGSGHERWDERWNMRKNFKKFKKARIGVSTELPDAPRRALVELEPTRRRAYGVVGNRWVSANNPKGSIESSANHGTRGLAPITVHEHRISTLPASHEQASDDIETVSQEVDKPVSNLIEMATRRVSSTSQSRDGGPIATSAAAHVSDDEEPTNIELEDVTQTLGRSQTSSIQSSRVRQGRKRKVPASESALQPAKRRLATNTVSTLAEDEDGDLKFRLRRQE